MNHPRNLPACPVSCRAHPSSAQGHLKRPCCCSSRRLA